MSMFSGSEQLLKKAKGKIQQIPILKNSLKVEFMSIVYLENSKIRELLLMMFFLALIHGLLEEGPLII